MNLDNNLNNNSKTDINNFINELSEFLENNIDGDLFTVDKIENEVALLENRRTKKLINLSLALLPKNIKESDIIKYTDGKYILENNETEKAKERINNKFQSLLKK